MKRMCIGEDDVLRMSTHNMFAEDIEDTIKSFAGPIDRLERNPVCRIQIGSDPR